MPPEPTLPAERTRLAWQRTVLAGVVCLLVVLRLLAEVSLPAGAALGLVVLMGMVILVATSIRRAVRGRQLTTQTAIGRNAALLSIVVGLACVVAIVYVVLV